MTRYSWLLSQRWDWSSLLSAVYTFHRVLLSHTCTSTKL